MTKSTIPASGFGPIKKLERLNLSEESCRFFYRSGNK
jgi:hypothetical protein